MKNKKYQNNSLSFVQLSNYTSPEIKEVNGKDWIKYGEDNNYFGYIIDRYTGSPTNNAAINGIIQMIYGKGLDATNSSNKPLEYARMKKLLTPECVYNCVNDLKLLGAYAIEVVYDKKRNIVECVHLPVETLRAEKCNEDGEIEAYYYYPDWEKLSPMDEPKRIPCFGTSKEPIEILYIKPYKSGYYYYAPVDYQGALQYAELEEEISNYHLNNILNGLAPSMLINMNNGVPDEETRHRIESDIKRKYGGSSNAGRFILSFNKEKENAATIEAVQLSDAHQQYQFLSDESMRKIMVGHRITSPMLLGIKDNTGLGNNADELKTASTLFDNTVIRPFQNLLIEGFNKILHHNDIVLNLYFKTLQPLEFVDIEGNVVDKETREEETGVKLSSDKEGNVVGKELIDLADDNLEGWELVDERDVDYELEDELDAEIERKNKKEKSTLSKIVNFVRSGRARPNRKSEQDKEIDGVKYKVRYRYSPLSAGENSRDFCKNMVRTNKLYRKEDIIAMGNQVVNKGWGLNGADKYSIWLYKGGGDCHHKWRRETYKYTGSGKASIGKSDDISTGKAEREGYRVRNPKEVSMKPKDMPNRGFVNKKM